MVRLSMVPFTLGYIIALMYLNRFTDNTLVKLAPIAFLVFATVYYWVIHRIKVSDLFQKNYYLIYLLTFLTIISVFRSNLSDKSFLNSVSTSIILVLIVILTLIMGILYSKKKYARFENVFYFLNILPFGIYALINILLWIFEFSFESTNELVIGRALLLEKFGIFVNRIKFPLANGINSYGTVVGGLLTISLVYLFVVKKNKLSTMGIITVLITTVLLTDSRGALIYSFLILGVIWYYRSSKSFPVVFKIVPLMPILGSFLLISVTQILSTTGLGAFLSRSSGDLESGNGRFLIWGYSLTEFIQFKIIQIIGYGDNGHVGSGVSNLWQNMFLTYGETTNMHPHNTTLAILFDIGYIGLAVYIYFLWRVLAIIQKFWNINRNFSLVMLSFLLYTVLIGITESLYGFYYQNSIYFFFSIFAIAFVAETIYDRQQVRKGKSRDLIKANWLN